MSWASFDDSYTDQKVWDGVSYETRWHYHALVSMCCRLGMWDGVLSRVRALRLSDVPDPRQCMFELLQIGLLEEIGGGNVRLTEIEHHVPPIGQREENLLPRKRENQRAYRQRKCDEGRHDRHCPSTCPARVTKWVTGNPGTGRGGSGREGKNAVKETNYETGEPRETGPTRPRLVPGDTHAGDCAGPDVVTFRGQRICRNCGRHMAA